MFIAFPPSGPAITGVDAVLGATICSVGDITADGQRASALNINESLGIVGQAADGRLTAGAVENRSGPPRWSACR